MSLRPPPLSRSPSPGQDNGRSTARQSLGPGTAIRGGAGLVPSSPRPGVGNARPTSELLGHGASGIFQTPEAEALDAWFENLQNYDQTLEEMAAASLDVNFKEELSAIEQWFKVLSEAERTAALYSLLQHSTQVQIRFFITVLQQMARSDPMTALLSPAMGSMQNQMEAKLASLKSPGLKSGLPSSPTTRGFNRQSLVLDNTSSSSSNFLSPESAATPPPPAGDAAATLANQRAKFKASNAAHRISAPVLASSGGGTATWGSQLSQLAEQNGPTQEVTIRPKSTEFNGPVANNNNEVTIPASDSWASMVNTPQIKMFPKERNPEPASTDSWNKSAAPGVPLMGDPTIHKRNHNGRNGDNAGVYDDGGNRMRNANGGWGSSRSPGLDATANNSMNGLAMQMGGFGMGLGSPLGMPNIGVPPISPFNNMLSAMGIPPETQLLAAQMAALQSGQNWMMPPNSAGSNHRRQPKSAGTKSPNSAGSGGTPKAEDDVDPALLEDIPAWLRSLRLHKYTPNFEGMRWRDMVVMDEAQLEAKGVAALGARRKMLKTFELVRKKMGMESPGSISSP